MKKVSNLSNQSKIYKTKVSGKKAEILMNTYFCVNNIYEFYHTKHFLILKNVNPVIVFLKFST